MAENDRVPGWVRYSGIGFELVGAVAGFTLIGYWLDGHYTSRPWGMIGGLVLGLTGGLYNLVRQALQAEREAKAADEAAQSRTTDPGGASGTGLES